MNNKTKYFIKNPEILESTLEGMDEEANKLLAENKRLRAALEEIEKLDCVCKHHTLETGHFPHCHGALAKKALKDTE